MPPPENTATTADAPAPAAAGVALHGCILVAEGDPVVAEQVRTLLTQAGGNVHLVPDGAAALERAGDLPPDLVLLDAALPGPACPDLVRRLKTVDETRFLPVVVLVNAAAGQRPDLAAGADDFLAKPIQAAELLSRARSLLRLGRLHQDLADNNSELQAAYETARESEAKYRALIQDAQDALFLLSPATATILEANRRACELSGFREDDLIGQPVSLLYPEHSAPPVSGLVARVLAEGRVTLDRVTLSRKDGTTLPTEVQASLASHHLGEPLVQALVRDLRPRQLLETEQARAERLAAVVETAVTVNHEINNPLFVITSSVEGLQRVLFSADSGVREKLDRINEACRRIQRFTQQLATVITPVSKEYMPGLKMLDLQQSVAPDAPEVSETRP